MKRSLYVLALLAIGSVSAYGQTTVPSTSVVEPIQSVNKTLFGDKPVAPTSDAKSTNVVALPSTDVALEAPDKNWAINVGVDYASAYYFRGFKNDDNGLMFQPSVDFAYTIYSKDGFSITPHAGAWASLSRYEGPSDPKNFYEIDAIGGVNFVKDAWTLGLLYTYYTSPAGAFKTQHEISATLNYDDSDLMKKVGIPFGFEPHIQLAQLVKNYGGPNGTYLEFGIAPVLNIPNTNWTLTLPVTVGTSPHNYYQTDKGHNDFLGYASAAVVLTVPLPIDQKFSQWSVHTSFEYDRLFSDSVVHANDGNSNAYMAKVGLSVAF